MNRCREGVKAGFCVVRGVAVNFDGGYVRRREVMKEWTKIKFMFLINQSFG